MASPPIFLSHFTLPLLICHLLLLLLTPISSLNITTLLSPYPDLSDFSALLSTTSVAADLSSRSSLTLLAVPNSFLRSSTLHLPSSTPLSDVLRYHVLLEYLSFPDLLRLPPSGRLITTLFQTTGRASNNLGSVNITRDPTTNSLTVLSPSLYSPSNSTVLSLVKSIPYTLTILTLSSLLIPSGSDLTASETRPLLGLNITKALIDGHNFNVAVSMLIASGVLSELEQDEGGAGITLFIPTDDAFSDLSIPATFQSLPADKKTVVLKFHVLHSYYPLGSLESIVNPVQPTLATEEMGAGSFTLNISRVNGSVAIATGIVQARVTQTVFDENPVAIFGISKVLLPKEIFGKNPNNGKDGSESAQPPVAVASAPEFNGPSVDLPAPTGFREEIKSGAGKCGVWRPFLASCCIGLYLLV